MKQRVNFFRSLSSAENPSAAVTPRSASYHAFTAIVLVGLGGLVIAGNYVKFQKQAKDFQKRLEVAERELKESAALLEQATREKHATEEKRSPAAYDGSWTSLVWKISAFTPADEILIQQLELTQNPVAAGASPSGPAGRVMSFKGLAKNLVSVKGWLESLSLNLPGFEFVLEKQATGANPNYPVEFRILASAT